MAIDTSIYSNIQPVKIESPLNMLAQVSQLKNMQSQNRLADLAYGQKQQEIDSTAAVNDAYKNALGADGSIDRAKLYSGIASSGQGAKLPGIQKTLTESDTAALTKKKTELDFALKKQSVVAQYAGAAHDQASWENGIRQLAAMGIDVSKVPQQYDPATAKVLRDQALTGVQQLEQHNKEIEQQLNLAKFGYQQQNDAANRSVTIRGQNMADARAREANGKGQFDTERGVLVDPRTGIARPVIGPDGNPLGAKPKTPTEFQGKSAAFGARAEAADRIIGELAGKYSPAAINSKNSVESVPLLGGVLGAATNAMALSPADQRAEQAQRDFINAVLRQESGAAIASSEFDNAKKQYFPQPGDSKEVIAQKARNRKIAIEGFKNSAGSAAFSAPPTSAAKQNGNKPSLDDIFK